MGSLTFELILTKPVALLSSRKRAVWAGSLMPQKHSTSIRCNQQEHRSTSARVRWYRAEVAERPHPDDYSSKVASIGE